MTSPPGSGELCSVNVLSSHTLRNQTPSPSSIGDVKEGKSVIFQGCTDLTTTVETLRDVKDEQNREASTAFDGLNAEAT